MSLDTGYTVAWLLWGAWFFSVEGPAIFTRNYKGTLTYHLRSWAGMEGKPRGWRIRRFTLLAGLAWLMAHLVFPPGTF